MDWNGPLSECVLESCVCLLSVCVLSHCVSVFLLHQPSQTNGQVVLKASTEMVLTKGEDAGEGGGEGELDDLAEVDEVELDDGFDAAVLVPDESGSSPEPSSFAAVELNVVYSFTYSVPTLYLRPSLADGSPVPMDAFTQALQATAGVESVASFVSQEEHPVFGGVYYFLHPCQASDRLGVLSAAAPDAAPPSPISTLVAWWGLMAPVVGVTLSAAACAKAMMLSSAK